MMLKKNFVSNSDELAASRSIKRIPTPPPRGSEHQGDSTQDDLAVHHRRQVTHRGSDDHATRGAGVCLMDAI